MKYSPSSNKICLFFRWFCHFDDDNYVNVPTLVQKLSQFDARQDWYLGKPSLPEPLEILDRDRNNHQVIFALPKAITSVAWKHVIHSFEPLVKIQVAKGISLYVLWGQP